MLSPPPPPSANTKVSSLIHPNSGDWNVLLINQLFLPTNATSILSIPLSSHKPRDKLVWAYTPKGNFTMNSAHKVAISMTQCNLVAETSHGALQTRFLVENMESTHSKQDKALYLENLPRYSPYKNQPLP